MGKYNNSNKLSTLEGWLWEAACTIRGEIDAPKFKDYILPLIFVKRLSDVFEDELEAMAEDFGGREAAEEIVEDDHGLVRFYIPGEARWPQIKKITTGLGQYLTDAVRSIARENPKLAGVVDLVDFNATASGQRIISDERLANLIQVLSRQRLGLNDVEPDIIGRAYEYLLRKFAEGQGQSAGEFYTPREVAWLMACILDPEPGESVYDPACGSGGLLIKCQIRLVEKYGVQKNGRKSLPSNLEQLYIYGQEINYGTYAMAKMNAFLHEMESEVRLGDTIINPAFSENGKLRGFNKVTANPMWNQKYSPSVFESDPYERFKYGAPPGSSSDWGWIQHMHASLNDQGKLALVLDTGAVSRGSGNQGSNRERDIRQKFVEEDLVECVILLPENLFYNTSAPGIIVVINKDKPEERKDKILLINASHQFEKGRPKNYLTDDNIEKVSSVYLEFREEEGLSSIIDNEEAARNDYNLSPSRYVAINDQEEVLPLEEAVVQLQAAEEERQAVDEELSGILQKLGLE